MTVGDTIHCTCVDPVTNAWRVDSTGTHTATVTFINGGIAYAIVHARADGEPVDAMITCPVPPVAEETT